MLQFNADEQFIFSEESNVYMYIYAMDLFSLHQFYLIVLFLILMLVYTIELF